MMMITDGLYGLMVYGLTVAMALKLLQNAMMNTACTRVQYFVSLASNVE
jgi:hypothetical protein